MKLTWTLLIVTAVFESSGARHVISDYKRSMPDQEPSRNDVYYIDLTERQDITDNDVTDAVEQ